MSQEQRSLFEGAFPDQICDNLLTKIIKNNSEFKNYRINRNS